MKFGDLSYGQWFVLPCADGLYDTEYRVSAMARASERSGMYHNGDGYRGKDFAPDDEVILINRPDRIAQRNAAKAAKYPPGTGMPKKRLDGF